MLATKTLGRTGIEVTNLGVGGFLGLLLDPEATPAQCEEAGLEAVRRAVELGVRYFDTSPAYGNGLSERHLAAGLEALDTEVRAGLTVSTKVGTHPERRYAYGADDVRWCFEASRELLGAIDVVLVHDPASDEHIDTILGPGGAFDALEELKAAGEIRAIGLGVRPHRFLSRAMESGRADVILPSYDYHLIRQFGGAAAGRGRGRGRGGHQRLPLPVGPARGCRPGPGGATGGGPEHADVARARKIAAWCRERGVQVGAAAVQFSLREPRIDATLVGPRTKEEVESCLRHATAELPGGIWEELEGFLAELEPPPEPGGEAP